MKTLLTIILLCSSSPKELSRKECLQIYRQSANVYEQIRPVRLKLKRIIYRPKMWDAEERKASTNLSIDKYFKEREFDKYHIHSAIVGKNPPSYYAYAQHIGDVCSKSTTILVANKQDFKAMLPIYKRMMIHEWNHALGGIHKPNKDYEPVLLEEQINNCLTSFK